MKILIVDDSKTYLTFASLALEGVGYQIVTSENMWISDLVIKEKPDLILMDVSLGHSFGPVAVTAIKKRGFGTGIKIYLHSSENATKLSELCLQCGADGFIFKDGDERSLVKSVRNALEVARLAEA